MIGFGCLILLVGMVNVVCVIGDGALVGGVGVYICGCGIVVFVVGIGGVGIYVVFVADLEVGYFVVFVSLVYGWVWIIVIGMLLFGAFVCIGGGVYFDVWMISLVPILSLDMMVLTVPVRLVVMLVTVTTTSRRVTLSWVGSIDVVGVIGYRVFCGGVWVGTTVVIAILAGTMFSDTMVPVGATSVYIVVAVDAVGNASAASVLVSVMLLAVTMSVSFASVADVIVCSVVFIVIGGNGI